MKRRNKEIVIGVSCFVAGVTVAEITVIVMRSNNLQRGLSVTDLQRGFSNTASLVFRNKQTVNVTTVLDREGRGHPGWPVRNVESKRIFFSQGEAARAFDVSESVMSGHLKGKLPDVGGLHFERINLQHVV